MSIDSLTRAEKIRKHQEEMKLKNEQEAMNILLNRNVSDEPADDKPTDEIQNVEDVSNKQICVLNERVNLRELHWIYGRTYEEFLQDSAKEIGRRNFDDDELKKKFNKIKRFCYLRIKGNGSVECKYQHSLRMPIEKKMGGRLFCGDSIQSISREYRGLLCHGITTDLDMKNAHPVILLWLCKKHGIEERAYLTDYVLRREEILALAGKGNREKAKYAFLENTNNSKHNLPDFGTPEFLSFLRHYANENKKIQKYLCALPEYKPIIDCVVKEKNKNGSGLDKILCYYENIILNYANDIVINKRGISVNTYMFDGEMLFGDYYNDTDLLREITEYVESKMNGLGMEWDYKEHSNAIKIPDDYVMQPITLNNENDVEYATNDEECGQIVYEKLKKTLIYCKSQIFMKIGNVWILDPVIIKAKITDFVRNQNIVKIVGKEKNEKQVWADYTPAEKIYKVVIDKVILHPQDDLYHKFHSTTKGKICFEDGVLYIERKKSYYGRMFMKM